MKRVMKAMARFAINAIFVVFSLACCLGSTLLLEVIDNIFGSPLGEATWWVQLSICAAFMFVIAAAVSIPLGGLRDTLFDVCNLWPNDD